MNSAESSSNQSHQTNSTQLEWLTKLSASALSGSASAVLTNSVLQPFDVIRTKQQLTEKQSGKLYGDFWSTVKRIRKEEGIKGFWRGLGPTLWRLIPGAAYYFWALEKTTSYMRTLSPNETGALPMHLSFAAAAISRGSASVFFLPITVVKTRFEAMGPNNTYKSTWHGIVQIASTEGVRGLWSGLIPTFLRDVPHSALQYTMYNSSKSVLNSLRASDSQIPIGILNFSAALFAGFSATVISHPFDVIRTRSQTQEIGKYKGVFALTSQILRVRQSLPFVTSPPPRFWLDSLDSNVLSSIGVYRKKALKHFPEVYFHD